MNLDDIRKLHQKKYRDELGYFLVEGEHLVLELQKALAGNTQLAACELYVTAARSGWSSPFRTHVISDAQMAKITETRTPQGIVALVPALRPQPSADGERAIYLHEIQDPGNLGTILRTLAWFGGLRCLLSPASVDPYNSKVLRASAGAIFHVPIEPDVELPSLPTRFKRIAVVDVKGAALPSPGFNSFDCYVFGNEARGLQPARLMAAGATTFTIPGRGTIDSLNLAAAVNICVYELNRQD